MTLSQILFIAFSAVTLVAALMVVTRRNLFHAAIALVVSFFGVAALYVLLDAYFFAAAQVLVYIGAISILLIFAVMLTRGVMNAEAVNSQWQAAVVIAGVLFVALLLLLGPIVINLFGRTFGNEAGSPFNPTRVASEIDGEAAIVALGRGFANPNEYLVPFLLSGVLIVIAMVGAIWVARERKPAEVLAERAEMAAEDTDESPVQPSLPLPNAAASEHH